MEKVLKLTHRSTKEKMTFTIKEADNRTFFEGIRAINESVKKEDIPVDVFAAPSDKEILDSLDKDLVMVAEANGELAGFMILLFRDDPQRNLHALSGLKEESMTFDNVEVMKKYRGYRLEKEFIKVALDVQESEGIPHLIAVVSENNFASLRSFLQSGFVVLKQEVPIYGTKRMLLEHKLG